MRLCEITNDTGCAQSGQPGRMRGAWLQTAHAPRLCCIKLPAQNVRLGFLHTSHRCFIVTPPCACTPGMYLWGRLPQGCPDDLTFCQQLVAEEGVALSPGRGFGPGGHG